MPDAHEDSASREASTGRRSGRVDRFTQRLRRSAGHPDVALAAQTPGSHAVTPEEIGTLQADQALSRLPVPPDDKEDRPILVPRSLRVAGAWSWRLIVSVVAVVGIGWALLQVKTVVVGLLIALILAVLLEPAARFLRTRLRFPRMLASAVTVVLTIALVAGALTFAGREIAGQFGELRDSAVAGWEQLISWLQGSSLSVSADQLQEWTDQAVGILQENQQRLVSGALSVGSTVLDIGTGAVVAIFTLLFFLKEGRRMWQWAVRLLPAPAREPVNEAGIRAWVTLGSYVRTQILVATADAIGIALGALILGVPFVVPIGVLVFVASFIPIVGAVLSGAVAVLVALVTQGPTTALIMLGVVLLVQQLESNVLQPWLMGNAVSLHPVVVFLGVTGGTILAGLLGALFAVPLLAVINTVVLYLSGHDKFPYLDTDWKRPGGPPGSLILSIRETYRRPTKSQPALTDEEIDSITIERAGGEDAVPVPTPSAVHEADSQAASLTTDETVGPLPQGAPAREDS